VDPFQKQLIELLREMSKPVVHKHVGPRHVYCPQCDHLVTPESEVGGSDNPEIYCQPWCKGHRARSLLRTMHESE
jgi:hypothetical protein